MLYRDICRTLSVYLWGLMIPLCAPLLIALACEYLGGPELFPQPPCTFAFFATIVIAFLLGAIFRWFGRGSTGLLFRREALLLVVLVYFLTPLVGSFPFLISKTLDSPLDAYFESVSGLTTTGVTVMEPKKYNPVTHQEEPIVKKFEISEEITYTYYGTIAPVLDPQTNKMLTGLDAVSPALLFWRSLMQWLGGGGIIVLFVAILPALGVGGKVLYQTEVTGPSKETMAPRIKETASWLWKIYLGLTALEIFLLMITNKKISLFDATTVSLSTLSTGGFTPMANSIASFNSPWTDLVVMIFMILGSISFSLYFLAMRGKFFRLNDPQLKVFLLIVLGSCAFATWQLAGEPKYSFVDPDMRGTFTWLEALRYGSFQVISAQTSTGFYTSNYDVWPFSIQTLMLILMFVGGMAGSTAGGLKVIRQQMFFRVMLNKIETIFRPDTVRTDRIGTTIIDKDVAITVLCYFMVAASLTIIGIFLFVWEGVDPETSLTAIGCMINNVGISFRMGGPLQSFAFLPDFCKLVGCVWMIAGRLEFFALLMILVPAFWRNR